MPCMAMHAPIQSNRTPTCTLPPCLQTCNTETNGYPFQDRSATVACRQMGQPTPGRVIPSTGLGPGSGPIFMSTMWCRGKEPNIEACSRMGIWGDVEECEPKNIVAIQCGIQPPPREHSTLVWQLVHL